MDEIRQQVARARRRLWTELFLGRLVRCWFAALAVAAVAIAVPKIVAIESLPGLWSTAWIAGAFVTGLLVALAWSWLRGRTALDAAIEIDRRFDLKERIASSLSLTPEQAQTPAGRALIADARRMVGRIDVDQRFKVRLGRAAWLPAGGVALALALATLVDDRAAQGRGELNGGLAAQAIDNAYAALRERLRQTREDAARRGLKDAEDLLTELERDLEQAAAERDRDPVKALAQLHDLSQDLQQRRDRLGGREELRRQMAGLGDLGQGPADKLVEGLRSGDWQQAEDELKKLDEMLAGGQLDETAQQQLAEQMQALHERLAEAAAQREQAMEELERKIDEQKRRGALAEAGAMQEQLERLQQRGQQAQQLEQLAEQMANAQQALEGGKPSAAAEALQQIAQQLEQMEQNAAEGEMLDAAMAQLDGAREAMTCAQCAGEGCTECQGPTAGDRPDSGRGEGIGTGSRPAEGPGQVVDAEFHDEQLEQQAGRGAAVITGEADGPTIRGNVREEIAAEMASAGAEPADPLVIDQLPRAQRENAEEFFLRLKDGE